MATEILAPGTSAATSAAVVLDAPTTFVMFGSTGPRVHPEASLDVEYKTPAGWAYGGTWFVGESPSIVVSAGEVRFVRYKQAADVRAFGVSRP